MTYCRVSSFSLSILSSSSLTHLIILHRIYTLRRCQTQCNQCRFTVLKTGTINADSWETINQLRPTFLLSRSSWRSKWGHRFEEWEMQGFWWLHCIVLCFCYNWFQEFCPEGKCEASSHAEVFWIQRCRPEKMNETKNIKKRNNLKFHELPKIKVRYVMFTAIRKPICTEMKMTTMKAPTHARKSILSTFHMK